MTQLSQIEGYIRELCQLHKQLRHDDGGTAFIPYSSTLPISDLKQVYVRVADVTHNSREGQLVWEVILEFLYNMDISVAREEEVNTATNLTQKIMYDFHARIQKQVDESCGFMHTLLPATMDAIGLADQSAIGWSYAWRFTTGEPDLDTTAWEDL